MIFLWFLPKNREKPSGLLANTKVCKNCQIPLAEECPDREKSFGTGTFGTVLGVNFDSEVMEWSLSRSKEEGLQKALDEFMAKNSCNLKDVQKQSWALALYFQVRSPLIFYPWITIALALILPIFRFAHHSIA